MAVSPQDGLSLLQFLTRVVSPHGGFSSGWSVLIAVSHQGGLFSWWFLIRLVSPWGGLFSWWFLIHVVSPQGGLLWCFFSLGWSLLRASLFMVVSVFFRMWMSCRAGSLPSARHARTTPVASTPSTLVSSRETSTTAAGESKTGVSCLAWAWIFLF